MERDKIGLAGSCLLGLSTPTLARVMSDALKGFESDLLFFLPFVVAGIFSWIVSTWVQSKPRTAAVLLYAAIPFGVLVDVVIDGALNNIDRNLFPLEILFWVALAPVPVWVGYLLRLRT